MTWRHLYERATARVGSKNDARRIVERTSGRAGAEFHVFLDEPVPDRAIPFFDAMVERRAGGEPLQYVVGQWGFRQLDLLVDRRVLIPRPETEQVVEVAIEEVRRTGVKRPEVVDLGVGSGAIALSLAVELPTARVWGTDRSAGAVAVARANLAGIGSLAATRVTLLQGSWFDALPEDLRGRVDLVISNPPYVATDDELPPEVANWEPPEALIAGPSGLEDVQQIVAEAPRWLCDGGLLVVEIAPHQSASASELARGAGFSDVEIRPDLAGRDRALVARTRPA